MQVSPDMSGDSKKQYDELPGRRGGLLAPAIAGGRSCQFPLTLIDDEVLA